MPNQGDKTIKDLLDKLMENYGYSDKLKEQEVIAVWNRVMGPFILSHTTRIRYDKNCIYVQLTTPSVKNELMMTRSAIIEKLNTELGSTLIKEMHIS
jgi:hypothetical protein